MDGDFDNKIRRRLLNKYPSFGFITANLDFIADYSIKLAETDGETLFYNPEFVRKLVDDEQIFLFAHQICHIAFDHISRSEGKDKRIWNIATNAVINQLLKQDGLPLISGFIDMPEAVNYDSEELYYKLLKEKKEKEYNEPQKDQPKHNLQDKIMEKETEKAKQYDYKNKQDVARLNMSEQSCGNTTQSKKDEQGEENAQNQQGQQQLNIQGQMGNIQSDKGQQKAQIEQKEQSQQNSILEGVENFNIGIDLHSLWEKFIEKKQMQENQQNLANKQNLGDQESNQKEKNSEQQNLDGEAFEQNQQNKMQDGKEIQDQYNNNQNGRNEQTKQQKDENKQQNAQNKQNQQGQQQSNTQGQMSNIQSNKGQQNTKRNQSQRFSQTPKNYQKTAEQVEQKNLQGIKKKEKETEEMLKYKKSKLVQQGEREIFRQNKIKRREQLKNLSRELANQSASLPGSEIQEEKHEIDNIGIARPLVDWKKELRDSLQYEQEYSRKYARVRKRNDERNDETEIFRYKIREEIPKFETEIIVDVSGSISEELLKNFLRECKNVFLNSKVKIGCFNVKFFGFQEVRRIEDIDKMRFPIGGGTDFDAAVGGFTKRARSKIILTDGYADMPKKFVPNVIWVVFGNKKIKPRGAKKVIYIMDEELKRLQKGYGYDR